MGTIHNGPKKSKKSPGQKLVNDYLLIYKSTKNAK